MFSITVICKIDNTAYKLRVNSTCIGTELDRTNTKPPKWQCLLSNILMHCLITPSPYFQQTLMIINYKMIFCYIYIKEAKLMNKNQSETSLIINLLHKKCFIHQLLKHNIINIQTTKNIDKTKLKDTCTRDQTAFWRHALNYYWRQQITFVVIQIVVQNYHFFYSSHSHAKIFFPTDLENNSYLLCQ